MKPRLPADWRWWSAATAGLVAGAAGWLFLRDFLTDEDPPEPRTELLQRRMNELAGPGAVQVRHLGDGIVELVGRIADPELESLLLAEASRVRGVAAVVSRLWGTDLPAAEGR